MADRNLPHVTPEQRRVAAGQFERAQQVITKGDHDYGIKLLLSCCRLDPGSMVYRQKLRQTEKAKYGNNLRGSSLAFLSTMSGRMKVRKLLRQEDHLKVLEYGEQVLVYNPWDIPIQLAMAESFEALGLMDLAVWTLDQARQKDPNHLKINRSLAILYEKRGAFAQAMALWDLVRKADPHDPVAQNKAKDLAASATIARGRYHEVVKRDSDEEQQPAETAAEHEPLAQTQPALPTVDRTEREAAPVRARIQADPANANAYLQLATVYRRAEKLDKAREALEEGLAATKNNFELALALAELDIEPFRQNLAVTEEKLHREPKNQELHKIRDRLLHEINNREMNIFRQKADRYPTELTHRFELGVRLLRLGQTDEAIRELQASRSDPRLYGRSLVYLGHCFKSRNNWRLAQRNFEEALQSLPAGEESLRKDIMFQLAQGYAEAGDLGRAIEQGYELANLDFSYQDIGRLIEDWQQRLQRA
jgi:tetratricopeptide (TPR) repeat protein